MSAGAALYRRLLLAATRAVADTPVRRHPNPAAASWRAWHRPDDLDLARELLARLDHHARTFPNPVELDAVVTRRAALDLIAPVR